MSVQLLMFVVEFLAVWTRLMAWDTTLNSLLSDRTFSVVEVTRVRPVILTLRSPYSRVLTVVS